MIREIQLTNFKGFKVLDMTLKNLNIFVGENGTGKSTIAHILSVLKKSAGSGGLNTDLPYINLGSLDRLINSGETASVEIAAEISVEHKSILGKVVDFVYKVKFDTQGPLLSGSHIKIQGERVSLGLETVWNRYGGSVVEPSSFQIEKFPDVTFNFHPTNAIGVLFNVGGYGFVSRPGQRPQIPSNVQEFANLTVNGLNAISQAPIDMLKHFEVVPVFRGFLEPSYPLLDSPLPDLNTRGQMNQMGASVAADLSYLRGQQRNKIRDWMKYVMDVDVEWYPILGSQIAIVNPLHDNFFVNEGFGSNQLIFVLVEIAKASNSSLIIIEEPEIHLHPKAQFKFGKLMAEIMKDADFQIILNTHSEHIIAGLLGAVRKKEFDPEKASIWLFEKDKGFNKATKAKISENGTTDIGMKTFVEASIAEFEDTIG